MELTNHTYLRSRVDMHIADSLRQRASSKIASGGMQDAKDDSGGFTAAVRLKSNQYMLQTKRANIQNSLTFLHAQREALNASRDIMDKMGELKLKFDAPTINRSDKANINNEFKELAIQLAGLRQQKFNGQSLFAESDESSSELFGGSKTGLAVGTETEGADASITKHGLDFQDIDSVYVAGEAVRRGIGGLDYVNFADEPVQKQVERVTITGGIAEGDTFSFFLNEKSQVGETQTTSDNGIGAQGSPHLISYTATLDDENSADPHGAVVNGLKALIDNLVGEPPEGGIDGVDGLKFVNAEIVTSPANTGILDIESSAAGDPFELFGATSTGSSGVLSIAETSGGALPAFVANDAEERTYELDLKDDDGNNSGYVIKAGDTISMTVDGSPLTYAPTQNQINAAPTDLSDPRNFTAAADFMLKGLMDAINTEADNNPAFRVRATDVDISGESARITLKSTLRGDPLSGVSFSRNMTRAEQPASGSTVTLEKERATEPEDEVTIRRFVGGVEQPADTLTFTQGAVGENGFTDFTDLAAKINAHSSGKYTASLNGNDILITDANPEAIAGIADPSDSDNSNGTDRVQRVELIVRQTQKDYVTDISSVNNLFSDKGDSFSNVSTVKVAGSGNNALEIDFSIDKASGTVDTTAANLVVQNAGSGYAKGDKFTVAGTEIGDTNGNSITFEVSEVSGNVMGFALNSFATAVTDTNFTRLATTTDSTLGSSVFLDVGIASGVLTANLNATGAGTGTFVVGDRITLDGASIGGVSGADDITFTVSAADIAVGGGLSGLGSNTAATSVNDTSFAGLAGPTNLTTNSTDGAGLKLDVSIVSGILTASIAGGVGEDGTQYVAGDTVTIAGTAIGGNAADDITLTINSAGTEVESFIHDSGVAQSVWNMVGTETTIAGAGLQITASAGRDGIISVDSIVDGGSGYAVSNNNTVRLVETGGTLSTNRLFNIDEIQDDFTDAKTTSSATGGTTTTDAERGDQFIASGPLDTSFTEVTGVIKPNVEGENRVRTVEVNADRKIAGTGNDTDRIHVGDVFTITVTEEKHDDETNGIWPESNTGGNTFGEQPNTRAAHSVTASYTAVANDDEDDVAAGLRQAYSLARTAYVATESLAEDDLPNATDTGNTITFTSGRKGEDFKVEWNQSPNPDVINATGAVNNPSGSASHIPNVSPFSITKSLDYFTEMLAQNAAETSRLMKSQEHLENSIVNTEHAWGKITDTDYARASTEQVRNSIKMQMASNIISKSIRMNDLLVDLTTKHHRGAVLNASV